MIRPARPADVPLMLRMLCESAAEQGSPQAIAVSETDLLEDGFGGQPRFQSLIAEVDDAPAGMALYFFNYSTWTGKPGLYVRHPSPCYIQFNALKLEDLFVKPEHRANGIGKALFGYLGRVAQEKVSISRPIWFLF